LNFGTIGTFGTDQLLRLGTALYLTMGGESAISRRLLDTYYSPEKK